jgi:8-oxo-dGTP pyrophosphatase MutT (NUDIX family)
MPTPVHNELHRVSVTGIIWRQGENGFEYLITKRSPQKKAFPNMWTVPGGGLEADDYVHTPPTHAGEQWYNSAELALRREIEEEVALKVTDIRYLLDLTFIRPDGVPALVLSYYCQYERGDVTLDEDSVDFAWVSAEDAKEYELIEGIKEEIMLVEQRLSELKV